MCLQFLRLLTSPSSFLACTLPTVGSANSVNSETTGVMNRISNTTSSSRSCWPREWTRVSCVSYIAGRFFTTEPPRKTPPHTHTHWSFLRSCEDCGKLSCVRGLEGSRVWVASPDLQSFLPKVYDDQNNSSIHENKQSLVGIRMLYLNQNEY